MKALIVAAGKGERINSGGREITPKPLYKCKNKYLIEHVIHNLELTELLLTNLEKKGINPLLEKGRS